VAEAAVVPVNHDIKGKEPDLYIALKPGFEASDELAKKISDAICRPDRQNCQAAQSLDRQDMPKTRSGKIMRRVLGALSNRRMWAMS
jgi:acetyl-CoA synthetase